MNWIDCAKGFGILLVIVGHTVYTGTFGNLARAIIFSFHMPLFFLLSSITFRYSISSDTFTANIKRAFRHLILPIFLLFVLWRVYMLIQDPSKLLDGQFWKLQFLSLLLGSGVECRFGNTTIPELGIPWFLYVLFFSRTLFDALQLRIPAKPLQIAVWLFSIVGVILGTHRIFLPFSFDIALAVLPFFAFGVVLKPKSDQTMTKKQLILCFAVWLLLFRLTTPHLSNWTYMELAQRRYPLYPLCFLGAAAGSLVFCEASKAVCRLGKIVMPVLYIGKNSLYLLMIHHLDTMWRPIWWMEGHQFVSTFLRITVDLFVFLLLMLLKKTIHPLSRSKGSAP